MKKIAVLGSTGSIGCQAVELLNGSETLKAEVLVTHSNVRKLIEQAEKLHPSAVGVIDESAVSREELEALGSYRVALGAEAYALCSEADEILFCIVGLDGLGALISYIEQGKRIALANKECLVSAGELITKKARLGQLIPVDSEHSAIWQCLGAGNSEDVKEIILTASGGRYYGLPENKLVSIPPEEAISHPNWKMGKKISVDSATMMNKALEILEARWLFGTENIGYIIHPESIIHSMVRFKDGAIIAQLSVPDMKLPISVALVYPERIEGSVRNFEFDRPLTFLQKREDVFFAPQLAYDCIKRGGSSGAVLDAADEGAVKLYLSGKIGFTDIAEIVRNELARAEILPHPSLGDIIEQHNEIRDSVLKNRERA